MMDDGACQYVSRSIRCQTSQKSLARTKNDQTLVGVGGCVSPARWWVWISSRPVRVLRDLRSLKATTGTTSSSLFSCEVLVPTGSFTASSIVPLCTGSVFSFGWASFGEILAGTDFCDKTY